jgi:hypothetical protein
VKIGFFTAHTDMQLPSAVLERLHAKSWSKLNLVEMIEDLNQWLGDCPGLPVNCSREQHA